jgi:ferredoxin
LSQGLPVALLSAAVFGGLSLMSDRPRGRHRAGILVMFTPEQLKDPAIQRSNEVLRTCVHCGFCTATCPTYQVLGDELDSPRGRIYLIKDMLENGRPADEKTVKHIDRCLSLPRLHDDLPLGRALHASRRPCARIHRADLQTPLGRARAALDAGADPALSDAVPRGAVGRQDRAALRAS